MSLSKRLARANCAEIIHPWTESCASGWWTMIRSSSVGSFKLFLPIMLVSYALKIQKKKKLDEKITREFIIDNLRCTVLGTSVATSLMFYSCLFRYLLGKYTRYTLIFVPGMLAGLSCVVCDPKRRLEVAAAFSNAALESVVLTMARSGVFPLNAYTETLFFMVANACLMYAVRVSESNAHSNYTWFFKPDADAAPDLDGKSFAEKLFKKTRKYFAIGVAFGILRTLVGDVTVVLPKNVHRLFTASTLKPGVFVGSYVAVYEFIVYILNRRFRRRRSDVFALPAGFLAGLTYAIEPSLPINISVLINLAQILYNSIDVRLLRLVPMDKICFSLSAGALFHIQMFHPKSISKVGSKIIRLTTSKKSDLITGALDKLINAAL